MATAAQMLEAFGDIGYLQRGRNLLAKADPDLMRQIEGAVDAGDPMALRKIMAANIGLSDAPKARMPDMPYPMPPAKPSTDAVERRLVEQDLGPVGEVMPQPAVRTALDEIIGAGGGDELIRRLGEQSFRSSTPEYSLDLFSSPSVLSQANTDILPPAAATADVNVGAAIPSSPSTAIIPAGPRGLSAGGGGGLIAPTGRGLTTTGGPRDLAVQGMESPAPRGLPAPNQARIEGPGQRRIEGPSQAEAGDNPYLAAIRGRWDTPAGRRAIDDFRRDVGVDTARPRIDDPEVPPRGQRGSPSGTRRRQVDPRLVAAGIGAGAAGLHMVNEHLTEGRPAGGSAVAGSGPATADLAAESAPPPRVPVASGELTPREQAHELIAKLNLMRRNAGGEVPEAPAMQREINRLLAMSNQTMAAASRGEVAMAGNDPHAQATRLLAQLNQMRREAGGEVPQAQQIMAEVARLNRLGDAQRNARTTAFPRRAG